MPKNTIDFVAADSTRDRTFVLGQDSDSFVVMAERRFYDLISILSSPFVRFNDSLTYISLAAGACSVVIFGASEGFSSCWVRDGREIYGRSCCEALHS